MDDNAFELHGVDRLFHDRVDVRQDRRAIFPARQMQQVPS